MPISQMILPEFDHEMANTRKTLERVPDDKFAWKPHEKSMSLGGLSTHLANIPSWTANTFDQDELDIVTAIIERAALAMENARLLAESQKRAAKERTIGEISSRISGLVNIENILETAIKELGTNLSNTDIAIQFTQEESEQNN